MTDEVLTMQKKKVDKEGLVEVICKSFSHVIRTGFNNERHLPTSRP